METINISMTKLVAEEGKYLTQLTVESESDRVFSKSVYCATDQMYRWQEVDEAYKMQWESEHFVNETIKEDGNIES